MSDVPSTSHQPDLNSGVRDSNTRSSMGPQQVGDSGRGDASLGQAQAASGSRSPHTLLPQEHKERAERRSLVRYLQCRSVGAPGRFRLQGVEHQLHSRAVSMLPELLTERRLGLGTVDKVFASQWLDASQVVCGTKCSTLFVLNVKTGHIMPIPLMQDRRVRRAHALPPSGICAIELNPSETLLATGGENSSSLAVYQLPELDPLCLGDRRSHRDAITSIAWIGDNVAVSGSWDGTLAVWEVDPDRMSSSHAGRSEQRLPVYAHISPRALEVFPAGSHYPGHTRVRALVFNRKRQELGALSLSGCFQLWKAQGTLTRLKFHRLPFDEASTCMTYCDDFSLYAVGFQSHISLLDLRQGNPSIGMQPMCYLQCGIDVRSMSAHQHIITMGTGHGRLFFFDIRTRRFLEERSVNSPDAFPEPSGRKLRLTCTKGWINQDDLWANGFRGNEDPPYAVYTHCYNWPEMKLFVGGGPLPLELRGNYAGIWT
ncbi:DDB1- and CUL4-associated factor 12-like protein 2 [Octodon degus]|uniref:DDB1- and CUL4-associated factor 12-like protein 2 n=1 Tax=Octodon degus TaxID=10160 RepID=A0A6P3FTP1_OCTDE|nr:DDB1- and CUL4-associated factor 12-like protein 2 [Octodon degus]